MTAIFTTISISIFAAILGLLLGSVLYGLIQRKREANRQSEAEEHVRQLTQSAERNAEHIVKEAKIEAKDLLFQTKSDIERKEKEKRAEWNAAEKNLLQREESFERKSSGFEKREEEAKRMAVATWESLIALSQLSCSGPGARPPRKRPCWNCMSG